MKKFLTFKTMIGKQVFSFLKNVLIFFIDRLYKEWGYMLANGQSNYCEKASERGDLFAKQLIENIIHDRARKYDRYELDGNATISYRTASVVLGKAHLTGLRSLRRTNICSLTEEGNRLFINTNLGAGPLTYQRQIVFGWGNFVRKATVLVSLIDIKVSVDFSIEKETGRNGFLLNFTIKELNGFKWIVNGFGYFDWAINMFLSFWTLFLRRIFRNLLENELEKYILNRLPKYQFPLEGTSCRSETKFSNQHELVENNEALLSESFDTRWSRLSPLDKSSAYDRLESEECGAGKDFGSNSEIKKTSRRFPESNKWISEMKSYPLPTQSIDLCSGSLNKNSCNEVSKDKTKEKCDPASELSRKTRELHRSYETIGRKLDLINHIKNSSSKEIALKKCLEILDEDDGEESANYASSTPAKGFENEQLLWSFERRGKVKSKLDFSRMPRDSYRYQYERASDKNILEPSSTESGTFLNITRDFDSERRRAQIDYLEKKFNGKKRNERGEDSNKTRHVSVESSNHFQSHEGNLSPQNLDLMLRFKRNKNETKEMFQNESPISCADDEYQKHAFLREYQIAYPEYVRRKNAENLSRNQRVKSPKIQCISNPGDKVDGHNLFRSSITSDSMQQIIQDENRFNLKADTEMVSRGLQFSENEVYDIFDKDFLKFYTTRAELNADSYPRAVGGCSVGNSSNSRESFNSSQLQTLFAASPSFPIHPFVCRSLDFNSKPSLNGSFNKSVGSGGTTLKSPSGPPKGRAKLGSIDSITSSWFQEISQFEKPACVNERDTECTDSKAAISSITGLKLNANSDKNSLEKMSDLQSLHDLQEEIIAETRKMISDVTLESAPEGSVHCIPTSSNENLEYHTNKSICNELNQVQRKDSKTDPTDASLLDNSPTLSSVKEQTSRKYENLTEFVYISESDTETSSEAENEQEKEM